MSYRATIDTLLRERAHEVGELSWRQQLGRKRSTMMWGWVFTVVGGVFAIICSVIALTFLWYDSHPPVPEWVIPRERAGVETVQEEEVYLELWIGITSTAFFIFAPLFAIGWPMTRIANRALAEQEVERQTDKAIRERFTELDMSHRVGSLGHLSSIEVERLRSIGVVTTEEVRQLREDQRQREERKEAGRVRKHQSKESALDRGLTVEQLLEKHKHDLTMWLERIKVEHKSAPEQAADELAAYAMERAVVDAIDEETDDDKKERMIRRLDRRLFR